MKTTIMFCCIVLLSITTVSLGAEVYFEDFESVTAVSWPSDPNIGLDANSLGDGDPNIAWRFEVDPNNGFVAINNAVPGTFDGDNYLRIERIANSYVNENFGCRGAIIDVNTLLSGSNVSLTFSFLQTNGDMLIALRKDDLTNAGAEAISLWFGPTGYVSNLYVGVYEPIPGLRYAENEWNQLRIDANYDTFTFDLYLNGQKVGGLAFNFPEIEVSEFLFEIGGRTSGPSTLYLDAIKIETGTTACSLPLEADITGDCKVDFQDYSVLAESWMSSNISN